MDRTWKRHAVTMIVIAACLVSWTPPAVARASDAGAAVSCRTVTYTPATAPRARAGSLCIPRTVTASTVVLLVHGGGGYTGRRDDLRAWQAFYGRHGIVTLSIDYALTGDRRGTTYPEPERNVKAAAQYLRLHEDELGTTRVVVQGHSAGARLGAIALTTPDDPSFSGPARHAGVSDAIDGFIGFYGYYGGAQFRPARYYGRTTPSDADSVANAADASGSALLFHGSADTLIPVGRSRRLADALRRSGVSAELVVVGGQGHGFDGYGQDQLTAAGARTAAQALRWLLAADGDVR